MVVLSYRKEAHAIQNATSYSSNLCIKKAIEEADTYLISYKLSEIGYKGVQA
jgi:hypothetical protein